MFRGLPNIFVFVQFYYFPNDKIPDPQNKLHALACVIILNVPSVSIGHYDWSLACVSCIRGRGSVRRWHMYRSVKYIYHSDYAYYIILLYRVSHRLRICIRRQLFFLYHDLIIINVVKILFCYNIFKYFRQILNH